MMQKHPQGMFMHPCPTTYVLAYQGRLYKLIGCNFLKNMFNI